jgi:hypothetical protein
VIFAHTVNRAREIFSSGSVCDGLHLDRILSI